MTQKRIVISAGETSGDEHGAEVAEAIFAANPAYEMRGMGGAKLRSAGVSLVVDAEKEASVMGFGDVLRAVPRIRRSLKAMKECLKDWRPDLLILIDYPDFNLKLAKFAHGLGIRVLYFITPKMWAWRPGRVELFKKYVNCAAVIFPFEKKFFEEKGYLKSVYVGHPFVEKFKDLRLSRDEKLSLRGKLGIPQDGELIAIFPGSRKSEVTRHLIPMLETFSLLKQTHPKLKGVINTVPGVRDVITQLLKERDNSISVVDGKSIEVLQVSDFGLLKSGTSNLQAAFLDLPFVMLYKTSVISEWIVRLLVSIRIFSPVNIVRPNTIVELMQTEATPRNAFSELEKIYPETVTEANRSLPDGPRMLSDFMEVRERLGSHDNLEIFDPNFTCYQRVAKLALSIIQSR